MPSIGYADCRTLRVGNLDGVVGGPVVPGACGGVAGFEGEPAVRLQGGADRGEGAANLVVLDQYLKGVAGHDYQVKLARPGGRREVAADPLDVRAPARLRQHAGCGIQPAEPAGVAGLAGPVQYLLAASATPHPGPPPQGRVSGY